MYSKMYIIYVKSSFRNNPLFDTQSG